LRLRGFYRSGPVVAGTAPWRRRQICSLLLSVSGYQKLLCPVLSGVLAHIAVTRQPSWGVFCAGRAHPALGEGSWSWSGLNGVATYHHSHLHAGGGPLRTWMVKRAWQFGRGGVLWAFMTLSSLHRRHLPGLPLQVTFRFSPLPYFFLFGAPIVGGGCAHFISFDGVLTGYDRVRHDRVLTGYRLGITGY